MQYTADNRNILFHYIIATNKPAEIISINSNTKHWRQLVYSTNKTCFHSILQTPSTRCKLAHMLHCTECSHDTNTWIQFI